jgi:hypothetical protein
MPSRDSPRLAPEVRHRSGQRGCNREGSDSNRVWGASHSRPEDPGPLSLRAGSLRVPTSVAFIANSRKNLGASTNRCRFSISCRVAWAASETMMVAHEGQTFRPRTLRFSV